MHVKGKITNDENVKHRAVVWVHSQVYEVLDTGECSGLVVHEIAPTPICFDGSTKQEAIQLAEQFTKEVKKVCR